MKQNMKRSIRLAAAVLCLTATAAWAAEDGKALFESKCTTCHPASRALSASKEKAAWDKTIERMKGKGAQLNAAEAAAVAGYLTKAAGK